MIQVLDNFINEEEINYILSNWDEENKKYCEGAIRFYFTDFLENKIDLSYINQGSFSTVKFDKVWLQRYDQEIDQITDFHGHRNIHNYVLYLNDGYSGGKIEFQNGVSLKPKKGMLVYFNNNELHRVKKCVGARFTLSLWGDDEVHLKYKKHETSKSII